MFMEVITWYVRVNDLNADADIPAITLRVTPEGLFNETIKYFLLLTNTQISIFNIYITMNVFI